MKRLVAIGLVFLWACSSASTKLPDAASGGDGATQDAAAAADTGTTNNDSGIQTDSGVTPSDSGVPQSDSGNPPQDSGTVTQDSGNPAMDSGVPPQDAGGGSDAEVFDGPHPTPGVCMPDPLGTGNSKNVGAYCTMGGNQCRQYSFANLCAIDLDPTNGSNFCLHLLCGSDSECGEQACCVGNGGPVKACIPAGCGCGDAGVTD
jgi:hypothetical protein